MIVRLLRNRFIQVQQCRGNHCPRGQFLDVYISGWRLFTDTDEFPGESMVRSKSLQARVKKSTQSLLHLPNAVVSERSTPVLDGLMSYTTMLYGCKGKISEACNSDRISAGIGSMEVSLVRILVRSILLLRD